MNRYRVQKITPELYVAEVRVGRGLWRELSRHCHREFAQDACDAELKREIEELNQRMTVTYVGEEKVG